MDVEWQVLQLLLSLAYRPSDVREDIVLDEKELFEPVDSEDLKKKEKEEWAKYLRQDDYKFDYTHDDVSWIFALKKCWSGEGTSLYLHLCKVF